MSIEGELAALTENWIRTDPRWGLFQRACGRGWDVRFAVMPDGIDEAIDWRNKVMTLAMWRWPDPKTRVAHTVWHVLLHEGAEWFTDEMCQEAEERAMFWLLVTAAPMLAA